MTELIKQRIEMINRGEVPEGYRKTKVGIVPSEWERYKLSAISAEIIETAGNNSYETLSISAGIGFVNQANKFGKELSGNQYSKYIVLKKGDFSYNKGNSKKYPQGCIYQLNDRDCAAVPNVFESFRLTNGVNNYYEQLFVSGFMNGQLFSKINHGVRDDGLLNLKSKDFYSSYVPFPPLPEQEKIAEILTTQDKVIELKQKLINEKKQQKKWLMQQLLTGKIRLKGFSGEWRTVKAKEIFKSIADKNHNGELTVLSATQDRGIIPRDDVEIDIKYDVNSLSSYKKVKRGEFVISLRSFQGGIEYSKFDGIVSPAYTVLTNIKPIEADYYKHFFKSVNYISRLNVAVYGIRDGKQISYSDFGIISIPFPPLPEQTAIAEILSTQDKEIELLEKDLEQEKLKKKALMQLLLTGKVRV